MTQSDPVMPDLKSIPDGDLVISYPGCVSLANANRMVDYFEKAFPGRKVLILSDGATIESIDSNKRLDAIEAKLDVLINQLVITGSEI